MMLRKPDLLKHLVARQLDRGLERGRVALLRWCALLAVFVLGARSASAAVVIESYVGPRPEHASEMLAPLIAELESLE